MHLSSHWLVKMMMLEVTLRIRLRGAEFGAMRVGLLVAGMLMVFVNMRLMERWLTVKVGEYMWIQEDHQDLRPPSYPHYHN